MRILWFTENYPPNKGGMARSCDRIVSSLRKHHTVDVFHFTNKHKPFKTQANINGSYTPVPVYEDTSHTLNVLWAQLSNKTQEQEKTILVAYGSHLSLKGIPLIAKWLQQPYLLCLRGNDFDTAIFSLKKQDLLYTIENAAAIACVSSEKVARIAAMELNRNLFFTPNAIAANSWSVLEADTKLSKSIRATFNPSDKTVIGLVGYLKQKKGISFFSKTLLKSNLVANVHLRIVGELEPEIAAELDQYNISYSAVIPESQSELIANYLSCDAIAIPSIYDGMPNVLFEAGILSIPIIASNAGGLPDVLDNTNAFVFDTLSGASLLTALEKFQQMPADKRQALSTRLKAKITQEHTPEKEAETYLKIFKQLH